VRVQSNHNLPGWPARHNHIRGKNAYTDQLPLRCRYLTLHFHIASLLLKSHTSSTAARSALIRQARAEYDKYLKQLDNYDILSKAEARLYEQLKEAPDTFSTASTTDAATRRGTKIARFKEEKALKEKMEVCLTACGGGIAIERENIEEDRANDAIVPTQ